MVCKYPGSHEQKEGKKLGSDMHSPLIQDSVITQQRLAIDWPPLFPDRAAIAGSQSEEYLKS
jgi:hypothetical protein